MLSLPLRLWALPYWAWNNGCFWRLRRPAWAPHPGTGALTGALFTARACEGAFVFWEKKSKISLCAENVTILTQFHATIKREKSGAGLPERVAARPTGNRRKGAGSGRALLHGGSAPGARPTGHNGARRTGRAHGKRQAAPAPAQPRRRRPRHRPAGGAPPEIGPCSAAPARRGTARRACMRPRRPARQSLPQKCGPHAGETAPPPAPCAWQRWPCAPSFVVAACGWVVKSGITMVMNAIETGNPFPPLAMCQSNGQRPALYYCAGCGPWRAGPWRRGHLHRSERHRGHHQRACLSAGAGCKLCGRALPPERRGA